MFHLIELSGPSRGQLRWAMLIYLQRQAWPFGATGFTVDQLVSSKSRAKGSEQKDHARAQPQNGAQIFKKFELALWKPESKVPEEEFRSCFWVEFKNEKEKEGNLLRRHGFSFESKLGSKISLSWHSKQERSSLEETVGILEKDLSNLENQVKESERILLEK